MMLSRHDDADGMPAIAVTPYATINFASVGLVFPLMPGFIGCHRHCPSLPSLHAHTLLTLIFRHA